MIFFWYRKIPLADKLYIAEVLLLANLLSSAIAILVKIPGYFTIIGFSGVIVFCAYLLSLRCPRCRVLLVKNQLSVFRFRNLICGPLPGRKCLKCDTDLSIADGDNTPTDPK
jgi:hypothetical protein